MNKREYGQAYQGGYSMTVRFLLSRGVPGEYAEEAAQAAWTKGWERRKQLRSPKRVVTWVNSIALNHFRNSLRKQQRSEELSEVSASPRVDPTAIDLHRSLQKCRRSDRKLLERHYLQGFTSNEIADQIGSTPVAVRVRLLRARQRVREMLEPRIGQQGRTSLSHGLGQAAAH